MNDTQAQGDLVKLADRLDKATSGGSFTEVCIAAQMATKALRQVATALQGRAQEGEPSDAAFLQEADQHLLHRFIETTEDGEGYDIGKDAVKRLAELGVVQSFGFGRYGVTMFGYWAHERFWHQNPGLPLLTNADRDARAALAQAQKERT